MSSSAKRVIANAATATAIVSAVVVGAFAVYLLVVGEGRQVFPGVPRGDPPGPPRVVYRPYPAAIIPLAAAALVLLGLLSGRQRPLAWAGLVFLALFGGLFVFGQGLPFLAAAALLLPL